MAKYKKHGRSTIKTGHKIDLNQAVVFLYGRLGLKAHAHGYCELHKCYLACRNVNEKRCVKKNCKYFKEVN